MEYNFYILENIRTRILGVLEARTLDELNFIHPNFNNNLIWNAAHCVATQQLLTYGRCGLTPRVPTQFVERNKKGTIPAGAYTEKDLDEIKSYLRNSPKWLREDYDNGLFKGFSPYSTSFGTDLNSIEDAIRFNNTHEGMHLGYLMGMRKLV